MRRRTLLATAASAVGSVAAAGCLTDDESGASTDERSTTADDETATTRDPDETTDDDDSFGWSEAANEPDPSKEVRIETSECYGWAEFVIDAEDELRGTYTIC